MTWGRHVPEVLRRVIGRLRGNVILMYHRVSHTDVDPWGLCVTPDHFEEQMRVLTSMAQPVPLVEIIERGRDSASVAVTFDDGYVDNLREARPILLRHGIPATVFVSTGYIGNSHGYWWDELAETFLQPGLLPGDQLRLTVRGSVHTWFIEEVDRKYTEDKCRTHRAWIAWKHAPPTSRHAVFHAVWRVLQQVTDQERRVHLDEIRKWAGNPLRVADVRCMNTGELREIVHEGLVTVGAHSVTHSRLSSLSKAEQVDEIRGSKRALESVLTRTVDAFSYPFGGRDDYGGEAVEAVRNAGFSVACSNSEGVVHRRSDRFQLPRLHVHDMDSSRFAAWLHGYTGRAHT